MLEVKAADIMRHGMAAAGETTMVEAREPAASLVQVTGQEHAS
jgi:hypothetical protein